jgi:hypothetical protein
MQLRQTRSRPKVLGERSPYFAAIGLVFVLVSAAVASGAAAPQPQTPGTVSNVRVNQVDTNDQHEPTLAVDPTNPENVLAAAKDWRTGPKQVWNYRSTDGGRTWADSHLNDLPTELPNQSDPAIAYDADGTAHMSYLGYNQNDFTIGGLFVTATTDTGVTWKRPVLVSANSDTVFNDKEWIAVDRGTASPNRGNIYVTWTLFTKQGQRNERGDIVISRSTDGGVTFSPRKVVSLPEQLSSQGSYPVVGPRGDVYVLYYSGPDAAEDPADSGEGTRGREARFQTSGPNALWVARSTDGGVTFPQTVRVATVARPPSPMPGSQFRIFVLPVMVADPRSGALYVTWNDFASSDSDVMLAGSTDAGVTWSTPVKVNDNPRTPRTDQFFPTLAVGADGAVHALWLDRRDDTTNDLYAAYYARSTDQGRTFSPNVRLSNARSDPGVGFEGTLIGDYIAVDTSQDGSRVYTAWVDTRGGNQDVYFSAFPSASGPDVGAQPPATSLPTPVAVPSPQPLTGFSDEAFLRAWERADRPVANAHTVRPWIWGPVSLAAANEPYAQGTGGQREVQYFDKARMEINNTRADRSSPFFVTNGLLVVEMISGRVQTGDAQFEQGARPPSQVPVAGDIDSPGALTYASLASVASLNNDNRAADRTGQGVTATLNRGGQVGDDPTRAGMVKIARFEKTLGHNIPDVFWTYMNATGPVYNGRFNSYSDAVIINWETDLGYPITEPYWTAVKAGGVSKQVLVQAFQRRVLTYVPDNPEGWKVEMGNVGRHYFDWRYRQTTPGGQRRLGR